MKHAGPAALDQLEPLLEQLRSLPALREKSRGVFYRRGQSFLHFHEDPQGLFADLRSNGEFVRYAVNSAEESASLFEHTVTALSPAN
jgi:hypothetical protein